VLVTGASGFVGEALVRKLAATGRAVTGVSRNGGDVNRPGLSGVKRYEDAAPLMAGHACMVHLAARVHVMNDAAQDPLAAFRAANVTLTLNLARQAAAAGLRRFVFISSIKVNGEATLPGQPFTEQDAFAPQDPYGVSKMEAEQGLHQIAAETGLEVVIIRPPLVYGPGVRANFAALMRAVARGVPLPLGAINNRRSLVALDNLLDFIVNCLSHPAAANQTFLVSDGEDLSTPELVRRMARAVGKPARLLPVPLWLLNAGALLLGKQDRLQRLCGSLQLDISKARDLLGWQPPISVNEGLRLTVADNRP
jgi:nucleoside-diphosphate-sugar epimerase